MVFTLRPDSTVAKLSKNIDLPLPFLLRPRDRKRLVYSPADPFVFDLYAFGKAEEAFPFFLITWREVDLSSLGIGRCRFAMRKVRLVNAKGEECGVIYQASSNLVHNLPLPPYLTPRWPQRTALTLGFQTPLTLKAEGAIQHRPRFRDIARRLRDKLSSLVQFYTDQELD